MVGLPCSGKTSMIKSDEFKNIVGGYEKVRDCFNWRSENVSDHKVITNSLWVVSADQIKSTYKDYDPEKAYEVHERSIREANRMYNDLLSSNYNRIVVDGGGINRSYTKNMAENAFNKGYNIVFCILRTPVHVCVERMKSRERKVPLDDIYLKNVKFHYCISQYKELEANNPDRYKVIIQEYYTNKYLFVDMDGTLCEYVKPLRDYCGDTDFINGDIFLNPKPVDKTINFIREWLKTNNSDNLYILTACPNSLAWNRKVTWLKKYVPEVKIDNVFFVGNKEYKHVFLRQYMQKEKWSDKDVTIIDDDRLVLEKVEKLGINFIHPTSI